jgi:GMP synthase-like glutamine amidotransferase
VKPILLVRNDGFETFGVAPGALARAGTDLVTVNMTDPSVALPSLDDVAGVVTFGGTVNVDQVDEYPQLGVVRQYTRDAIDRGVPYLGICLGSQILARALGTDVVKGPVKEVGFEPVRLTPDAKEDALLSFLEPEERVMQWHEDTHDLPQGATLLMTGDRIPVQAYRVGEAAWGVQFHLEVEASELAWWIEAADAAMDLEATWGKSADQIRAEAERHIERHEERGREIFTRFAGIVHANARG